MATTLPDFRNRDLTALTPAQIDAEWYLLADALSTIANRAANLKKAAEKNPAVQADLDAAREEFRSLSEQERPAYDEFRRRGGWSRYYLVTASNGHVHLGTTCSTCFPDTSYAWLPDLSGLGEDALIEKHGWRICTVCFPNAPVCPPGVVKAKRAEEATRTKHQRLVDLWTKNCDAAQRDLDKAIEKSGHSREQWAQAKAEYQSAAAWSDGGRGVDAWRETFLEWDADPNCRGTSYASDLADAKHKVKYFKGQLATAKRKLAKLAEQEVK